MQRINLTPDMNISRMAYGMWRILNDPDHSAAHLQSKMEACLQLGITTFDQADIYGGYEAEEAFGQTLRSAPELRDKIEIITKCGIVAPAGRYSHHRVKHYDTSEKHIVQSVEASLKLMSIDVIDLLLIHRPDPFMDPFETARSLDALVDSGKIRAVGVSNFKPFEIDLLSSAMHHPLVTNQIEISLTSNDSLTNGDMAYLQQHRIAAMAWSPLGGGSLLKSSNNDLMDKMEELAKANETDIAAIAVAWLLAHPAGIIPVIGTNSINRIKNISGAMNINIDRETWFELYSLANGHEVP